MRIAFVHEYLNQFGGAERMLEVLADLYPRAPIYTLIYDKQATGGVFEGRVIRRSFLDKTPFAKKYHWAFPLLMPMAIEQFDFSGYDIVVSLSASFAKGVITLPGVKHICYCLTPPRFLWDDSQKFVEDFGYPSLVKNTLPPFITYLRMWDQEASKRADEFWAISDFVKRRIEKYYRKPSRIIYPPVDVNKFHLASARGSYFFMAGRLVSYKKFDIAIRAFNELKMPLKIAGIGPEMNRLKKIAGPTIEFLGLVTDRQLADFYSNARALIFPQEEDFGIVPLESMASGRPVIAHRGGGALETVIEGKTGLFFNGNENGSLVETVRSFNDFDFKPDDCREQAQKFDVRVFKQNIIQQLS